MAPYTIETSIALLSFTVQPPAEGESGAFLAWSSQPGPEDLAGYRVERAAVGNSWLTIVPLTRETSVRDPEGTPGNRYRLIAVNGLGQELVLGEAQLGLQLPLNVWPLPYRGGELSISFAAAGDWGMGEVSLDLYDVSGRLVRALVHGRFEAGQHTSVWDGMDSQGQPVSNGVYFVRMESAGVAKQMKLVVMR